MSFGNLQFSQKTNKTIQLYYNGTSSRIVFVPYLGELKTPRRHFKINWPLGQIFVAFSAYLNFNIWSGFLNRTRHFKFAKMRSFCKRLGSVQYLLFDTHYYSIYYIQVEEHMSRQKSPKVRFENATYAVDFLTLYNGVKSFFNSKLFLF